MITNEDVLDALRTVQDPELGQDLVTLNMIRDIRIEGERVLFTVVLPTWSRRGHRNKRIWCRP